MDTQEIELPELHAELIQQLRDKVVECEDANTTLVIRGGKLLDRIKELEAIVESKEKLQSWLEKSLTAANAHINALQLRLGWMLVGAGLPTEPGCYEFTDGTCDDTACYELDNNRWFSKGLADRRSPLDVYGYTHYRRIELPKGGES